jgi:multiple sugar transport system substrate-binding protein
MSYESKLAGPTSRRQFVSGGALLAASAYLAACGGSSSQSPVGGKKVVDDAKLAATLRWAMFCDSQADCAVWGTLANDVHAKYPGVNVQLQTVGFDDYWDKIVTQIASGNPPEILVMQDQRMPEFVARKALRPLDDYIKGDPAINYDDFFKPIRDGMSVDGRPYALAYDLGPLLLFYNKDMFRKAGIAAPSPKQPMSWDDFRSICKELTSAAAGQYGFATYPSMDNTVPWIWSAGGDYMDAAQTHCTLDSPEAKAGIEFITSIFIKDKTGAPITDLSNRQFGNEQFYSGRAGMLIDGPWAAAAIAASAKFDWDFVAVPAGPAGSVTYAAGSGFGISTDAKDPDAAWKAIEVLTNTASMIKLVEGNRGFMARASASQAYDERPAPPKNREVIAGVLDGTIAKARPYKTTTTWQETVVMLSREFTPVYLGRQSVDDTVARVKPKFDKLLERHQQLLKRA